LKVRGELDIQITEGLLTLVEGWTGDDEAEIEDKVKDWIDEKEFSGRWK
jgi:hypothetical protein